MTGFNFVSHALGVGFCEILLRFWNDDQLNGHNDCEFCL